MSPLGKRRRGKRAPQGPPPPQPDVRQPAILRLPGDESYDARVISVDAREIVLVLLLEARDPVKPGDVASMELEFGGARGLVTIEGEGTVEEHDLVRFRMDGAVEILQRRDFVRVSVVRPMAIAPVEEDGRVGPWIDTLTINVSGNGLLASGPDTLAIDADVHFRLRLHEGEAPIQGVGRVMRASDEGHRGVRILEMSEDARRRLVAFIFERERIARRLTRDAEL